GSLLYCAGATVTGTIYVCCAPALSVPATVRKYTMLLFPELRKDAWIPPPHAGVRVKIAISSNIPIRQVTDRMRRLPLEFFRDTPIPRNTSPGIPSENAMRNGEVPEAA